MSTCIPFNLNLSEFLVGQSVSLQIDIVGSGKDKEHIIDQVIEQRCRVQIVVPVEDLNPTEPNLQIGFLSLDPVTYRFIENLERRQRCRGGTEEKWRYGGVRVFFLVVYDSEKNKPQPIRIESEINPYQKKTTESIKLLNALE